MISRLTIVRHLALACALLTVALGAARVQPDNPGEWRELFNHHDLDGWEQVGPGNFTILQGLLKPHGGRGLLWYTKEKIGNSTLRVTFQTVRSDSKSGVFIRMPAKPRGPSNTGYEIPIDDSADDNHCTGVLDSLTKALARPQKKPGEWNTMDITLDGPRTIVVLNGVKVTDYAEGQPLPPNSRPADPNRGRRPNEGYIGIENHNPNDVVYFQDVTVKPLKH